MTSPVATLENPTQVIMVKRLGSAYDSPKHVSLIITNSRYGSKVFRASWHTIHVEDA